MTRDASEGKGSRRRPQKRLNMRLVGVVKAVGGGYCRLQMPLKPALGVRETVAGHRLGTLERGGQGGTPPPLPMHPWRWQCSSTSAESYQYPWGQHTHTTQTGNSQDSEQQRPACTDSRQAQSQQKQRPGAFLWYMAHTGMKNTQTHTHTRHRLHHGGGRQGAVGWNRGGGGAGGGGIGATTDPPSPCHGARGSPRGTHTCGEICTEGSLPWGTFSSKTPFWYIRRHQLWSRSQYCAAGQCSTSRTHVQYSRPPSANRNTPCGRRERGPGALHGVPFNWGGGGAWHEAVVLVCLPLAVPIGLSPLLILTLCGPERVLGVSTEPPDDLSCLTAPGVGCPGDGAVARAIDQVHPDAHSRFADSSADLCAPHVWASAGEVP